MDSIYQLKTGEYVDLNRIVKIDILTKTKDTWSYKITFQLVQNVDDVIILPSPLVREEMKKVYDEEMIKLTSPGRLPRIDEPPLEVQAREIALGVYKKFAERVYNDLVTAWKEFKNNKND